MDVKQLKEQLQGVPYDLAATDEEIDALIIYEGLLTDRLVEQTSDPLELAKLLQKRLKDASGLPEGDRDCRIIEKLARLLG